MRKLFTGPLIFSLLILTTLFSGCGSSTPQAVAPRAPNGAPIRIAFYLDPGFEQIDSTNPNQVDQRTALAKYIVQDMSSRLNSAGYAYRVLDSPDQYNPASGEYLLSMKVVRYNAGSKAARIVVGFGAGKSSMVSWAGLFRGDQKLTEKNQDIHTSRSSWEHIVTKTNSLILLHIVNYTR